MIWLSERLLTGGPPSFPLANAACAFPRFLQKEEYHTHLAVLYLDAVLQHRAGTSGKGSEVTETQAKLRRLLQKSDLYRVHFLMGEQDLGSLSTDSAVGRARAAEVTVSAWLLVLFLGDSLSLFWHLVSLPRGSGEATCVPSSSHPHKWTVAFYLQSILLIIHCS